MLQIMLYDSVASLNFRAFVLQLCLPLASLHSLQNSDQQLAGFNEIQLLFDEVNEEIMLA